MGKGMLYFGSVAEVSGQKEVTGQDYHIKQYIIVFDLVPELGALIPNKKSE